MRNFFFGPRKGIVARYAHAATEPVRRLEFISFPREINMCRFAIASATTAALAFDRTSNLPE